ncbi:MAG TPA: hypothetical protein VNC61_02475 [Acidimicrobiales bacterium]|nr:hypothetical protein [Acidimicrobiales bacterium]
MIDHLLSREPSTAEERRTSGKADRRSPKSASTSVSAVLHQTSATVLGAHLAWLVARGQRTGQLSAQRVILEDQARVLIYALDERGEKDIMARSIGAFWNPDDVADDDDAILGYASALGLATADEPDHSPYVALAKSAGVATTEILDQRGASADRRHVG